MAPVQPKASGLFASGYAALTVGKRAGGHARAQWSICVHALVRTRAFMCGARACDRADDGSDCANSPGAAVSSVSDALR